MPRSTPLRRGGPRLVVLAALAVPSLALGGAAGPLAAQEWNGPRVLELVARARSVRHEVHTDTGLESYQADARGYVYFFLDRPDSDERTLVKTDQVALQVFWKAPDQAKQRIVGLRDRKTLPTNIKYHLDHLTVVQDEFEDHIRLGDGDEVADVTHPVAPGAEGVYDYRLSDSLTISFSGGAEDVRVYEIQVRPKDMDRPGFVGTLFLDRKTAAIVRMSFTFTPASYVDPYLDYIRISLDNSLWMGRYWLPYRQEAELRRELPALDFLAGSIIRGRFEIGGYEFNKELPDGLFRTRGVSAVPEAQRRAFPFEDSLYAHLDEEGLATPPSLAEIREQARQIVQDRYLSGLHRLRLHIPSASSAYRYDRAEGSFLGLGTTFRPGEQWALKAYGGYGFGRERPTASLELVHGERGATPVRAEAWLGRLQDMGPLPAASGAVNTLAALTADEDWTDPWFTSGVGLRAVLPAVDRLLGAVPSLEARWERHRAASSVVAGGGDGGFRPVRPAEEGDLVELGPSLTWGDGVDATDGWGVELSGSVLGFEDRWLGRSRLAAAWAREGGWRTLDLALRLDAGVVGRGAPPQLLYLLGGRETLLGQPFRHFVGNAFWLVRGEVGRSVTDPWLSLRAFVSAGQAGGLGRDALPAGWTDLDPGGDLLLSAGAGVGLLWNVLRIDAGHGLDGGGWEAAFSVTRRFRSWL